MIKISLITMHRIYNYGSILQTYATQKIIEEMGAECEIVDYISPHRAKKVLFWEYPTYLKGKKIRKCVYYFAKIPSFILKELSFGSFIKRYLNLTKQQYITNMELLNNPPIADVYMTGSDQVWNSKYNQGVDESYYLNYAPKGAKKVAFVASFGRTILEKEEQKKIKPLLQEYALITVREESAVSILSNMEISSVCLIDPTLQMAREHWLELASKPLVQEKYLLLFLLYNEDNGATDYAKKVAGKLGLKIVKLSWELKKPEGIDKLFTHRKPQDFLALFANADFVVTNSFHGVAFSINFNRQFVFVPRSEFNGRIESLLKLAGLNNRKVNNINDLKIINEKIEYKSINIWLEYERQKALKYIKDTLF